MFHKHEISLDGSSYIYRDDMCKRYYYNDINKIEYTESPFYEYNEDCKYICHILKTDDKVGPLFSDELCAAYLDYLTTSICSNDVYSEYLLSFIFRKLGIIPGLKFWNKFESILEEVSKRDNRLCLIWDKYNFISVFKPVRGDARYFMTMPIRKSILSADADDISSLSRLIFTYPLPAPRPEYPIISTIELPDGRYLYRNTYVYNPTGSHIDGSEYLNKDGKLIKQIMDGTLHTTNTQHVNSVILKLITNDHMEDADEDTSGHVISTVYMENDLKMILDILSVEPHTQRFKNLENYIYAHGDSELISAWLNWNYFETDYINAGKTMKGILSNEQKYFSMLYRT